MKNHSTRRLTVTAMLGALGFVLMMLNFSVPLMPAFIKFDFSELPPMLASFALGPLSGAAVCLIKNVLAAIFKTSTLGIGELSNFIIGIAFVIPAGLIYKKNKTHRGALAATAIGALCAVGVSVVSNYYLIYPLFGKLVIPMDRILDMYRAVNPDIQTLWQAILLFNAPFTAVKTALTAAAVTLIYKKLSPILKG